MSREKITESYIFSYNTVFNRLKKCTDLDKQSDIAELIGITQTSVSRRKKDDVWPIEWAYIVGKKYNLLTEWILTGEGPRRLSEIDSCTMPQKSYFREIEEWGKPISEI